MANVTYDLLWRDTMRDLLDMLELDPPQDQDEQDSFQHFSFLYIRYVQIFKNLEDCYDQHCHPQKRLDIKEVLESVMGRILEIKEYLVKLSGFKFINFDDILVDLKLIPETLELPVQEILKNNRHIHPTSNVLGFGSKLSDVYEFMQVPRYFVDERAKDLELREKLVKTLIAARDADAEEQPDDRAEQKISMDDAIRFIQVNERGRQGKQRARFMREIRKQEELDRKMREMGQPEPDPDNAAGTHFICLLGQNFKY